MKIVITKQNLSINLFLFVYTSDHDSAVTAGAREANKEWSNLKRSIPEYVKKINCYIFIF